MASITNGGFETGDLTGWDPSERSGGVLEVGEAYKYTGNYGLGMSGRRDLAPSGWSSAEIAVWDIDFSQLSALKFALKVPFYSGTPAKTLFLVSVPGAWYEGWSGAVQLEVTVEQDWTVHTLSLEDIYDELGEPFTEGYLFFSARSYYSDVAGAGIDAYLDAISVVGVTSGTEIGIPLRRSVGLSVPGGTVLGRGPRWG
jgi:hypothetical protein